MQSAAIYLALLSTVVLALGLGRAQAAEVGLSYAPAAAPMAPLLPEPPSRQLDAESGRVCYNPIQTREEIATHRLAEPFRALQMGQFEGEALRARLCRLKPGQFVYDIAVLRWDGRLVHVYMNAQNGKSAGGAEPVRR